MKLFNLGAACCALALLAGCESTPLGDELPLVSLGAREAPRSRTFQADQRTTYEAARAVMEQMGFKFERGGPAQGQIVALGDVARNSEGGRQISMKVELSPAADSGTEMVLSFTEILEGGSGQPGLATQTPLKDTPLYEDFFRNVARKLESQPKN